MSAHLGALFVVLCERTNAHLTPFREKCKGKFLMGSYFVFAERIKKNRARNGAVLGGFLGVLARAF